MAFQPIGCKYFGTTARQIEVKHQREGGFFENAGGPAMGSSYRGIEVAVRVGELWRALVAEIGECATSGQCGIAFRAVTSVREKWPPSCRQFLPILR